MEGMAAYSVSKHGIEAYSDALRQEMVKWKVGVSVIQPAGFLTGAVNCNLIEVTSNLIHACRFITVVSYSVET